MGCVGDGMADESRGAQLSSDPAWGDGCEVAFVVEFAIAPLNGELKRGWRVGPFVGDGKGVLDVVARAIMLLDTGGGRLQHGKLRKSEGARDRSAMTREDDIALTDLIEER